MKEKFAFVAKVMAAHVLTYVICGMLAMTLFDYQGSVEAIGMRGTDDLMVQLAPLFQIARGVLFGIGSGIQQISTIYYISKTADKKVVTMAISVCVSFVSLGATLSPLVINGLQMLLFGAEGAASSLLVAGCGFAALALLEGVSHNASKGAGIGPKRPWQG